MSNQQTFFQRLKKAPKSLAVIGIFLTGTIHWWWPLLEAATSGHFGPEVQQWATLTLTILTVLGWAKPQPRLFADTSAPRPYSER